MSSLSASSRKAWAWKGRVKWLASMNSTSCVSRGSWAVGACCATAVARGVSRQQDSRETMRAFIGNPVRACSCPPQFSDAYGVPARMVHEAGRADKWVVHRQRGGGAERRLAPPVAYLVRKDERGLLAVRRVRLYERRNARTETVLMETPPVPFDLIRVKGGDFDVADAVDVGDLLLFMHR